MFCESPSTNDTSTLKEETSSNAHPIENKANKKVEMFQKVKNNELTTICRIHISAFFALCLLIFEYIRFETLHPLQRARTGPKLFPDRDWCIPTMHQSWIPGINEQIWAPFVLFKYISHQWRFTAYGGIRSMSLVISSCRIHCFPIRKIARKCDKKLCKELPIARTGMKKLRAFYTWWDE